MWRKIRTFELIDGKVKGKTRADALNAGIKKAISDAMQATRRRSAHEKANEKAALNTHAISSFFKPKPVMREEASMPRDNRRDQLSSPRGDSPRRKKAKHVSPGRDDRKKSLQKRPRIELTPPGREKRRHSSPGLASSSQRQKSPRNEEPRHQPRPTQRLQQFIDRIQDKQRDHGTSLNAYLRLDEEKRELQQELRERTTTQRDGHNQTRPQKPATSWEKSRKAHRDKDGGGRKYDQLDHWLESRDKTKRWISDASSQGTVPKERRQHEKSPMSPHKSREKLSFLMDDDTERTPKKKSRLESPGRKRDGLPKKVW
ncbi:hypothetical protein PINS_up013402 [Pythium insidiosum]|nr:hypothetical protein PINS_up013402 [Pythium insidiosum]